MSLLNASPHAAKKPNHADEQLAAALGAVANLNDVLGMIHRGVQSLNGAQSVGVQARPLSGVGQVLSSSAGRLAGYTLRETAGAVATVRIHDGFDATGDLLATVALPAAGSADQWLMPHGVAFVYGIWVEIVTGTVEGAVYLAPASLR